MKHTYIKPDKPIIDGNGFTLLGTCKKCGCKREKDTHGSIWYLRSGRMLEYSPDCIDWDLENSKTID